MGWPGPMTNRQFIIWLAWQDMQWDRPTKLEWYVMACTYQVYLSRLGEKSVPDSFDKFVLQFSKERQERSSQSTTEDTSRDTWLAVMEASKKR